MACLHKEEEDNGKGKSAYITPCCKPECWWRVSGTFCRGGAWMMVFEKILVVCPRLLRSTASQTMLPRWDEFIPQAYRLSHDAFGKT